ncbi:jg18071, partial [Pararge aegeria aegeria]
MPLDLKVREVCLIENTRLTGATEYLPDDIRLERPTPPRLMLHPAERLTFPAQF